jgi:NADPH:quinone reductase-like Zn-dependent oxidoreductase
LAPRYWRPPAPTRNAGRASIYGADVAINYRTQDFVQVGKEFTGGRGVDAILDMVGGNYIPPQLDLLAREGRLCFVALMQGTRVEADFGLIQRKHLTVTGSTLRSRSVGRLDDAREIIAQLRAITPLLMPRAVPLRNAAQRELYLSGLRLASGEAP